MAELKIPDIYNGLIFKSPVEDKIVPAGNILSTPSKAEEQPTEPTNISPRLIILLRFPGESVEDYLDRCYAHDHRFHGGRIGGIDKTRYPVEIDGYLYYPKFKTPIA